MRIVRVNNFAALALSIHISRLYIAAGTAVKIQKYTKRLKTDSFLRAAVNESRRVVVVPIIRASQGASDADRRINRVNRMVARSRLTIQMPHANSNWAAEDVKNG